MSQSTLTPTANPTGLRSVAILWRDPVSAVTIQVTHGRLVALRAGNNAGASVDRQTGTIRIASGVKRLVVDIDDARLTPGAMATRLTTRFGAEESSSALSTNAFTCFLRDVSSDTPILVRPLAAAIVPADEPRGYAEIEADVVAKGRSTENQRLQDAPEETYESACRATRDLWCPTWLGLGRDVRLFRVSPQATSLSNGSGYWGQIEPWNHSTARNVPDNKEPVRYAFVLGRGSMCSIDIERSLEDGVLPILRSIQRDGEIEYHLTLFATLETRPLTAAAVRGTHPTAALVNTGSPALTKQERAAYDTQLFATEIRGREEEIVCWVHVSAVNTGAVPRYAYFQGVSESPASCRFDPVTGYSQHDNGEVVAINRLDGQPMPQREMAVLLQPGKSLTLDLLFPHRPLSAARAAALAGESFALHHEACRTFWQGKLDASAKISLPEPAIDERVRAGLLHLDLNTLGFADEGHLLAAVGSYAPIGSESAPIIQFFDSMGWHGIAERAIQFFLDRQRDDGFIQTYIGYQLETGPVLWTIGEHFRYTRDLDWARRIQPRVFKACNYLLDWRRRNQREELRGNGYGLLEGKVADPEDFFHSFMLNGLTYVGLKRIAEIYRDIDPQAALALAGEIETYLLDIRTAYAQNVANSPVVPLGDGTWAPSFGPWTESAGPVSLFADGGDWLYHRIFACRDSLIGALYLGIGEVLDPREPMADWLLHVHQELMTHRNAGFTQPYYCRHDWLHLKRGEVKPFLKTYYNQLAALQDRSTYTFWEVYWQEWKHSQHKTHEEGWFLMQTRWMLWDEDHASGTLRLLSMIPRAWMEDGKQITLDRCASYFGPFSLSVHSEVEQGRIHATVTLHDAARVPQRLSIRLPHPHHQHPCEISGGQYDPVTESVLITPLSGPVTVTMRFT